MTVLELGLGDKSVLGKTVRIFEAFRGSPTMTLAGLAQETGFAKSTLHRICGALVVGGLLERRGDVYCLGSTMFEYGSSAKKYALIRAAAHPNLGDLFLRVRETVHLGVLENSDVLFLEKLSGRDSLSPHSKTGCRLPAATTALGKAMLAFLDRSRTDTMIVPVPQLTPYTLTDRARLDLEFANIRVEGFAVDREERRVGVCCVAAPIFGRSGEVVAAVSVCGSVSRIDPEIMASSVKATARDVSRALGHDGGRLPG